MNIAPLILSIQGQSFCPLVGGYLKIFLISSVLLLVQHQRIKPNIQDNIFQNLYVILEEISSMKTVRVPNLIMENEF
jgi:hypothetical protein